MSEEKNFNKIKKISFDHVINLSGYVEHKNISLIHKGHYKSVKNLFTTFKKILSLIQVGFSRIWEFKSSTFRSKLNYAQGNYGRAKFNQLNFY